MPNSFRFNNNSGITVRKIKQNVSITTECNLVILSNVIEMQKSFQYLLNRYPNREVLLSAYPSLAGFKFSDLRPKCA